MDRATAMRIERAEGAGMAGFVRHWHSLYPQDDGVAEPLAGGWLVAGPPPDFANRGLGLGFEPTDPGVHEQLGRFYRQRGRPPRLDLCPFARDEFIAALCRDGYAIEFFIQVYVWPSKELPPPNGAEVPTRVVNRDDPDEVRRAAEVIARGFLERNPSEEELRPFIVSITQPGLRTYLAESEGSPVGGAAMALCDGVATLFGGSTLPEARRRGIQMSLMRTRLAHAAAVGADLVSVTCAPGSPAARNAERLSGAVAYTKAWMVAPRQ